MLECGPESPLCGVKNARKVAHDQGPGPVPDPRALSDDVVVARGGGGALPPPPRRVGRARLVLVPVVGSAVVSAPPGGPGAYPPVGDAAAEAQNLGALSDASGVYLVLPPVLSVFLIPVTGSLRHP